MHTIYNKGLERQLKTGPLKIHHPSGSIASLLKKNYQSSESVQCYSTSYVTYNGVTYRPDAFILFSANSVQPVFKKVLSIIKCDAEAFLVLDEILTKYYDDHYHSYCISTEQGDVCVHNVKYLPFCWIFHARRNFAQDGNLYLTFKYIIDC